MKKIIAFDGGGTKTRCVVCESSGKVLADITAGPSNHQMIGKQETREILSLLFDKAIQVSHIEKEDLDYVYLGLAGADLEEDFKLLNEICEDVFSPLPYEVTNDAWIIMRSGLRSSWGAVSICGTGSNAAAVHPNGDKTILRSLGYHLGGYGGGGDMAIEALHHAFRSDEHTGPYSRLEDEIPKLMNKTSMTELVPMLYPTDKLSFEDYRQIPPLVFRLASEGDSVSKNILIEMGKVQGQMVAGIIKKLKMNTLKVPVVLGGSIFKGTCSLFIDTLEKEIKDVAPDAYLIQPTAPPILGAVLSGFDQLNTELDDLSYDNLINNLD